VILYVLLCGYPPFRGKTLPELSTNIMKGRFSFKGKEWESISANAKDMINKLLEVDPDKRISA
jgi:calcium-dependent protein kinase